MSERAGTGTAAVAAPDRGGPLALADRWPWFVRLRERVCRLPGGRTTWRVLIAVAGGLVVAGGIVLLPLPGPGWVIIFGGIGIWATEFTWAARLLGWAQARVADGGGWLKRQSRVVQAVTVLAVVVVVVAAVLGAYLLVRRSNRYGSRPGRTGHRAPRGRARPAGPRARRGPVRPTWRSSRG